MNIRSLIVFLCVIPLFVHSQSVRKDGGRTHYPVPPNAFLVRQEAEAEKYLAEHPGQPSHLRKTTGWGFAIGSTRSWNAVDFVSGEYYSVPSTCRGIGTSCYVFVEDAMWGGRVTQAAVDSVVAGFDQRTPANPNRGIFAMDTAAFGPPPDVDGDPRIIIFILNILDGYDGSGGYIAGYFTKVNETSATGSNQAEMLYIDADPADLTSPDDLRDVLGTVAHEFQHMIHYRADGAELTFVNEMCSLTAEVICGYPLYNQMLYCAETGRYLFDWRTLDPVAVLADYSRASRFGLYLRDQFGAGLFRHIVGSTLTGMNGLNDAFQKYGTTLRFADVFRAWLVANVLDDRTVDTLYGYKTLNLPKVTGKKFYNPNYETPAGAATAMKKMSAEYLRYTNCTGFTLRVNTGSPAPASMKIKAVELGPGLTRVIDCSPGADFAEPQMGTAVREIVIIVYNESNTNAYPYSMKSTGTILNPHVELLWDVNEPERDLNLDTGDTVCVAFDAVAGARLDSVIVGFRRAGSIVGGVFRYTGALRPNPLGERLAFPLTVSLATTPATPFPVPYNNIAVMDVRSYAIDCSQPFAVAFGIGSDPHTPGIMAARYPGQDMYHSFTYLSQEVPPNWFYLVADDQNVWTYHVRAYVTFPGVDGVEEHAELTPAKFSLGRNYPNPFNPSTHIGFELPEAGTVHFEVFDVLGRRVAVLADGMFQAGRHAAVWNAVSAPSGVYFCRIVINGASGTVYTGVQKAVVEK